jgi:hypothetical protein
MPFENRLDGADEDDVIGLAEHIGAHFPEWKPQIDDAFHQPERFRSDVLRHVVRGTLTGIIEIERMRKGHPPSTGQWREVTDEEATRKATALINCIPPHAIEFYAQRKRLDFHAAKEELRQRFKRGYKAGNY